MPADLGHDGPIHRMASSWTTPLIGRTTMHVRCSPFGFPSCHPDFPGESGVPSAWRGQPPGLGRHSSAGVRIRGDSGRVRSIGARSSQARLTAYQQSPPGKWFRAPRTISPGIPVALGNHYNVRQPAITVATADDHGLAVADACRRVVPTCGPAAMPVVVAESPVRQKRLELSITAGDGAVGETVDDTAGSRGSVSSGARSVWVRRADSNVPPNPDRGSYCGH